MVGCTSAAGSRPKPHRRLQSPRSGGLAHHADTMEEQRASLPPREMETDASLRLSGESEVDHRQSTRKHAAT